MLKITQQQPQVEKQRAKSSDDDTCWIIVIQPMHWILSHKECTYLYVLFGHLHTHTHTLLIKTPLDSADRVPGFVTPSYFKVGKNQQSHRNLHSEWSEEEPKEEKTPPHHCCSDRSGRERKEEGVQIINGCRSSTLEMKKKWEKEEKREPRIWNRVWINDTKSIKAIKQSEKRMLSNHEPLHAT